VSNQKRGVVRFDPAQARLRDAEADAIIGYARRVKDWPLLEQAVDQKLQDQREFVAWWQATVTPNAGAGRGNKNQRRPGLVLQADAETQTGITHQTVARWRERLRRPDSYRARLFGAAYNVAMYGENVRGCSGDNEWCTPANIVALVREVLGGIDLDPASNAEAQRIVRAKRFYSKGDNGLDRAWRGRVFLNPPYSAVIAAFVDKLLHEYRAGRVSAAILLTNNSTDAAWFHQAAAAADALCFTLGRIAFCKSTGEVGAPPQGQALFYYGPDRSRFIQTFARHGTIVRVEATESCAELSEAAE
jgi:phage N-6-adenine-methyltransferase